MKTTNYTLASRAWQRCAFYPITRITLKWNSISLIFQAMRQFAPIYETDVY